MIDLLECRMERSLHQIISHQKKVEKRARWGDRFWPSKASAESHAYGLIPGLTSNGGAEKVPARGPKNQICPFAIEVRGKEVYRGFGRKCISKGTLRPCQRELWFR